MSCRGRGCPRHRLRAAGRRLPRLLASLDGRAYRAGDRLLIAVDRPGYKPEQVAVKIRYGALPQVRLL